MKNNVPLKAICFFMLFCALSFTIKAQSLQGGAIEATSVCLEYNVPAPDINNIAAATGGVQPYTYQWEAKIDLSGWAPVVVGGNGLSCSPGILGYNTNYRRKVTDANGAVSYSNEVRLYIISDFFAGRVTIDTTLQYAYFLPGSIIPKLNSSPADKGTGNYGYTWETATNPSGPWSEIIGETELTYRPAPINTVGTYYFRKKATDAICSNTSAYTNIVAIHIVNSLPFNQAYWTYRYPCVFPNNLPSKLEGLPPMGGTAPYTFQWEKKGESDASWTPIFGETNQSYQPPIINETTQFRRKATDANGTFAYTNDDAIYYVNTIPDPGMIASNETAIAPNAPYDAAIDIKSASNFYNGGYVWQSSLDNGNTWIDIPNYTYGTYFPSTYTSPSTICYRRAIREYCASDVRDTWTNTVCIQPTLPLTDGTISINGGNTACNTPGSSAVTITGTPATGGATPYIYKWQIFDGSNWVDIANTNSESYTPEVLNYSAKYRRVVTDANNTSLTSNEVIVSIQSNSPLRGGLIDGPIVTCSNTAPGIINNIIDACGGGGVFTYSWEASTNGGPWVVIAGADQPTYNATNISENTTYRRKIGDGCGSATYSNEVEVFVYPEIEGGTLTPATQSVCAGDVPELLGLTQNCHYTNGNVTYQWQRATSPNGTWTNLNGATQPVLLPKASNTSSYYRLMVKSSVCNAEAVSTVAAVMVNNCNGKDLSNNENTLQPSTLSVRDGMKLYPNPVAKGQTVSITLNGNSNTNYKATLRSIDGRTYSSTIEGAFSKGLQIKLPTNLVQGTYLLQVSNGTKQWIERIVVL
ncbi:MAG: T9SS type A sorting domain-containing protein [Chitinophagaceae bacterium]|nr:T9SS type A sorting domain-containing protein [Chitinophagaceae bacterium]MCW5904009.1 T9SS type A sorting domain-containing protein [Chitinophagaceae bacterium]